MTPKQKLETEMAKRRWMNRAGGNVIRITITKSQADKLAKMSVGEAAAIRRRIANGEKAEDLLGPTPEEILQDNTDPFKDDSDPFIPAE